MASFKKTSCRAEQSWSWWCPGHRDAHAPARAPWWGPLVQGQKCPSSRPKLPRCPTRLWLRVVWAVFDLKTSGRRKHTDLQLIYVVFICTDTYVGCQPLVPPEISGAFHGKGPQRTPWCVTSVPGPVGPTLAEERLSQAAVVRVSMPFSSSTDPDCLTVPVVGALGAAGLGLLVLDPSPVWTQGVHQAAVTHRLHWAVGGTRVLLDSGP